MKRLLLFSCLFFLPLISWAKTLNLPTQVIGNTEFFVYSVQKKDNIYSVSTKLKVSKDDILKYNPHAADGIKPGDKLFFPVNDFTDEEASNNNVVSPATFTHTVGKGESLYGISKLYNVSIDDIVSLNPHARDGVRQGDVLEIPQMKVESVSINETPTPSSSIIFHTIKKGDTLYNVANKYSTSIERILELNPGISAQNFKLNEVIRIEPNSMTEEAPEPTVARFYTYRVSSNSETFYSIAKAHNISEKQLVDANPDVKVLKKGVYLYIPEIENSVAESEVMTDVVTEVDSVAVVEEPATSIDVALILPFMLNENPVKKQAQLYTEFYKGFLMAVDSVKYKVDKPLNIYAFDSYDSVDSIKSILSNPVMKEMELIFAPDDVRQLEVVSDFGKENGIKVVNTFIIKNEMYSENAELMQMNIPHTLMYSKVVEEIKELFGNRHFIFIGMEGDEANDKELVKELSHSLDTDTVTVRLESSLTTEILDNYIKPEYNYVIVPTNSNRKTLSKINVALKRYKAEHPECDFVLMGYPEWITMRNDYKETFHAIDTYIYSRFYADTESLDYRLFEYHFKKWYGSSLLNAAPVFGILGFDSGMFILSNLIMNGNKFPSSMERYEGIQNDWEMERVSNWGGYINKAVYFIHFDTTGAVKIIRK